MCCEPSACHCGLFNYVTHLARGLAEANLSGGRIKSGAQHILMLPERETEAFVHLSLSWELTGDDG